MKQITISSVDMNISFSHGLPFFDCGVHFVMGKIHAMEIRQFFPEQINLNFLNAASSFCRSSRFTSKTWPLRPPDGILVLWVLLTSIFPIFLILNMVVAFTSYQSLLENESTALFLAPFCPSKPKPFTRHLFLPATMVLTQRTKRGSRWLFIFHIDSHAEELNDFETL